MHSCGVLYLIHGARKTIQGASISTAGSLRDARTDKVVTCRRLCASHFANPNCTPGHRHMPLCGSDAPPAQSTERAALSANHCKSSFHILSPTGTRACTHARTHTCCCRCGCKPPSPSVQARLACDASCKHVSRTPREHIQRINPAATRGEKHVWYNSYLRPSPRG